MKQYTKLTIPEDSAWSRKTWRYYTPIWFNRLVDSLRNLIDWFPIIWRDRHWDDFYILQVIQRKVELQRSYIVSNNRHLDVGIDNRDMTWALNLIERMHHEYYSLEQYDYQDSDIEFVDVEERPGNKEVKWNIKWEKYDEYFAKYKATVRKVKKLHSKKIKDKRDLAFWVAHHNQEKANKLFWRIMAERSFRWWD